MLVVILACLVWIRPALIQRAVDVHISAGDMEGLFHVFLMVVVVLMVEALIQYRVTYLANWVAQSVSLDLRAKLYRHVTRFRLKYFDQTPVGALVTRHVSDIDGIANVFSNGILNAVGDLLSLAVVLIAMFWIDWGLALIVLLPIPVLLVATRLFQKAHQECICRREESSRQNQRVCPRTCDGDAHCAGVQSGIARGGSV